MNGIILHVILQFDGDGVGEGMFRNVFQVFRLLTSHLFCSTSSILKSQRSCFA